MPGFMLCSRHPEILNFGTKCPTNYFPFAQGPANHIASPAYGVRAVRVDWTRWCRALSVTLEKIWLFPLEQWGAMEGELEREAGSLWRKADQIMQEWMWQKPRATVHAPGGDGPASGPGDKGREGWWQ